MAHTGTRDLVVAPHRLVAVEQEDGVILVDVSPFRVDLLEGPEAAPLRKRLAGLCYMVDMTGAHEDPWFADGVCEHLEIVAMRRCLDGIPHQCAVEALNASWT